MKNRKWILVFVGAMFLSFEFGFGSIRKINRNIAADGDGVVPLNHTQVTSVSAFICESESNKNGLLVTFMEEGRPNENRVMSTVISPLGIQIRNQYLFIVNKDEWTQLGHIGKTQGQMPYGCTLYTVDSNLAASTIEGERNKKPEICSLDGGDDDGPTCIRETYRYIVPNANTLTFSCQRWLDTDSHERKDFIRNLPPNVSSCTAGPYVQ